MIKYVYMILGLLFLGAGAAGVILPLIPTTPLVLLAAFCFGKSSKRLHDWFVSTGLYKNSVEGFVKKRVMTVRAKFMLLAMVTVFMGGSLIAMLVAGAPLVPQVVLGVIWVGHVVYFGFIVKTV